MKVIRFFVVFLAAVLVGSLVLLNCKSKTETGKATETTEAAVAPNQLTQTEIDEGWVLLFDGKSTEGWRGYQKETFPEVGWAIENEAIKCIHSGTGEAGKGGDIIYDKKFKNFHLKLEWMIGKGGNSGIFYLAQELPDKPIFASAPEMQILDNFSDHPDNNLGKDGNRRAGSLYDLIPPSPQNAKGSMEWNSVEILVYDGTVVHTMNGENVIEYHLWTDKWNEMVANSKFPDYNEDWANVAKEGYIGLQDHGNDVWFRNIKIKEL